MDFSPPLSLYPAPCSNGLSVATRSPLGSGLSPPRPPLSMPMAVRPSAALAEHDNKPSSSSSTSSSSSSSSSSSPGIPKMEPFNRSRISRFIKEPSLLEKAEHAISDRCSILEGDDAYRCWEALFEFENLKQEYTVQCDVAPSSERQSACRPLERLENLVRQSGGVASLINNVRMLAKASEMRKSALAQEEAPTVSESTHHKHDGHDGDGADGHDGDGGADDHVHFFPEPGSLPPSEEELELERSARMPESPFTRVLRKMGNPSSWFSQQPGFEIV